MKKVPTIFDRDWEGDKSRVVNSVTPGCEWVLNGEGWPTRKLDGTASLVQAGKLYKRHQVKEGKPEPNGFVEVDHDETTGKRVGWVPVGDGSEDKFFRQAFNGDEPDGTYELVGPKVQGGVEGFEQPTLVPHTSKALLLANEEVPRGFHDLRDWLYGKNFEGIVWHHEDGRMAKIKLRDFGIKRGTA